MRMMILAVGQPVRSTSNQTTLLAGPKPPFLFAWRNAGPRRCSSGDTSPPSCPHRRKTGKLLIMVVGFLPPPARSFVLGRIHQNRRTHRLAQWLSVSRQFGRCA